MRIVTPSASGARQSPGASSGSGSGSGNSSRKRVRENANGDAAEVVMRDAGPEDDEEYFDVDMDVQEAYDEMEAAAAQERAPSQVVRKSDDALFVPYYAHFGSSDFDDEYVLFE